MHKIAQTLRTVGYVACQQRNNQCALEMPGQPTPPARTAPEAAARPPRELADRSARVRQGGRDLQIVQAGVVSDLRGREAVHGVVTERPAFSRGTPPTSRKLHSSFQ
jgi:hypothetical protein